MRASKTDFKKLVEVIVRLEKGKTKRIMWAIALAELLKDSNPQFDKRKFVDAVLKEISLDKEIAL